MEKKKGLIGGALLAGALVAAGGLNANASGLFNYNSLGTGEVIRARLTGNFDAGKTLELKCGEKSKSDTTSKKGKDGKCGEGKCGNNKDTKGKDKKKGKDGKCGAHKNGI